MTTQTTTDLMSPVARPRLVRRAAAEVVRRPRWERNYSVALVAIDGIAVAMAAALAYIGRFGLDQPWAELPEVGLPYALVAALAVPVWLCLIAVGGGYEGQVVGLGSDEYRRVLGAAAAFFAFVATVSYLATVDVGRGFLAILVFLGTALTLSGRYAARQWLHWQRGQGRFTHRLLVLGPVGAVTELIRHLNRAPYAGFSVVGACVPDLTGAVRVDDVEVPIYGSAGAVPEALQLCQASVLAVAGDNSEAGGTLSRLSWQLHGTGVELIVAPAVTDVAGPRIAIRPLAGLPLLHVEEPRLSGAARLFKEVFDRSLAALALTAMFPLLLTIGAAVRATSPGPALFWQERVGRHGNRFKMPKFRTMVDSAETQRELLMSLNEHDGPLFKMRRDPRRTPLGCWLRRFSLDELPQLWNVVTGEMSLVGPRPPLPEEVDRYGDDVRRRLLVKPGLTGLWQVSGRSDLPWKEAVRLDLYYVENWSPALDFLILWKTMRAVVRGQGAY